MSTPNLHLALLRWLAVLLAAMAWNGTAAAAPFSVGAFSL